MDLDTLNQTGFGKVLYSHESFLTFVTQESQAAWANELLYQTVNCAYKFSIALTYYRIFIVRRSRAILKYAVIAICAYSVWSVLQTVLQCIPISASWRRAALEPGDRCLLLDVQLWSLGVPNVVLNWMLLFIPIHAIWKLQMSHGQKTKELALMCLRNL